MILIFCILIIYPVDYFCQSFESYVQEIGRAGRDGEPAHCHLFLDPEVKKKSSLELIVYVKVKDIFSMWLFMPYILASEYNSWYLH